MSQSAQKVQPPRVDNVVFEEGVFLREVPKVFVIISLPCAAASSYQFRIHWWDEAVFCQNT